MSISLMDLMVACYMDTSSNTMVLLSLLMKLVATVHYNTIITIQQLEELCMIPLVKFNDCIITTE